APLGGNAYARKRAKPFANVAVDATLVRAVRDKVVACYEDEQGAAPGEEDLALLREYGADVVRELADGLAGTGCAVGERASERCLERLGELECAKLAEPIVAAGWDRYLSPQARIQVADYASMLARRELRCSGRDAEEAQIVGGVRRDRLAV